MYSNDMNGDGVTNDLIYIPKTKDEIKFTSAEDADAFWKFVNQDPYLKKHKGEYAGTSFLDQNLKEKNYDKY